MKKLLTIFLFAALQTQAAKPIQHHLHRYSFASMRYELIGGSNYYFSTTGNDVTGNGSIGSPWKTISKLNSFFINLQPGDSVLFKRGETFYGSITISKSGALNNPIVIGAYSTGADPIITGMNELSFTSIGNNLWEADAPLPVAKAKMVILDNYPVGIGRWPNRSAANSGYMTIDANTSTSITDAALPSTPNWTGGSIVLRRARWKIDPETITAHSGTTITYSGSSGSAPVGYGYFIQNHILTLDQNGEWFHNTSTDKITMYYNGNLALHTVEVAELDRLLYSSGKSYVTITGLFFRGAQNNCIDVASGTDIKLINCDVSYSGINGIKTSGMTRFYMNYDTVKHSHNSGLIFQSIGGSYVGNSRFNSSGRIAGMGEANSDGYRGIGINSPASDYTFEYLQVDTSGSTGIIIKGNNAVLRKSLVNYHDFNKDDGGGGVYMQDKDGTIRYNRVIDHVISINGIGAAAGTNSSNSASVGIYLDDGANHVKITNCTVTDDQRGVYFHQAFNNRLSNLTSFNNKVQLYMQRDNATLTHHDDTLTNNILFNANNSQRIFEANWYGGYSDIGTIGRIDSNYYVAPNDTLDIIKIGIGTTKYYEFGQWRTAYPMYDRNSKRSPIHYPANVNITDSIRFEYNAKKDSVTILLNGKTYIDSRGVRYRKGFLRLGPYDSWVGMLTSNISLQPEDPPVGGGDPPPGPQIPVDPPPAPAINQIIKGKRFIFKNL